MPPTLPDAAPGRPYFDRVESLRGLGTLAVAGFHFSGCVLHGFVLLPHVRWPNWDPVQHAIGRAGLALLAGHPALMAFFVISGFVLRVSLGHGPKSVPAASAKFLIARAFRFYPIVAVGTAVAALVTAYLKGTDALTPGLVVRNLLLLDVSLNPHLWALQVELLMVPVILAVFFAERRWGPYVVAAVAVAATGLSFSTRWAGWPPLSANLFAFALGMTVPTLGRRFAAGLSRRAATLYLVGAAVTVLSTGPVFGVYSRAASLIEAYVAAGAVSLMAYRPDVAALRALDARWLRRLGQASGSYYVLHMASIPAAMAVATAVVPADWSARAPGVVGVGVVAVWLAAVAPLMMTVSLLVEAPGIAAGRRVVRSLRLDSRPQRESRPVVPEVPERQAA